MSKYTGTTKGGFVIDESWQANDGLVNEISAKAPLGAPQSEYTNGAGLFPGQWYVMPTFRGDHMSLQGGLTKRINVKPFYLELAKLLAEVSKKYTTKMKGFVLQTDYSMIAVFHINDDYEKNSQNKIDESATI